MNEQSNEPAKRSSSPEEFQTQFNALTEASFIQLEVSDKFNVKFTMDGMFWVVTDASTEHRKPEQRLPSDTLLPCLANLLALGSFPYQTVQGQVWKYSPRKEQDLVVYLAGDKECTPTVLAFGYEQDDGHDAFWELSVVPEYPST